MTPEIPSDIKKRLSPEDEALLYEWSIRIAFYLSSVSHLMLNPNISEEDLRVEIKEAKGLLIPDRETPTLVN